MGDYIMSTLKVDNIQNSAGTRDLFLATAWVNFNGTGAVIRDSGNVSSITDNATGNFTVNFGMLMDNANYSSVVSVSIGDGTVANESAGWVFSKTTSGFSLITTNQAGTARDRLINDIVVFGGVS